MHDIGGGFWSFVRYDHDPHAPKVNRALLRRVFGYGLPYRGLLLGVLVTILVVSGLSVVPPLIVRDLVDNAIPDSDVGRLTFLGIAMVVVPLISAVVGAVQRWMAARAGEGIIYDLRRGLYAHLQNMSLRFFTETKAGELISRLDNDVVGAQTAITGTFVTIVANTVSVTAVLAVMLQADWRLTLLAVAAMPLFIYPARRVGRLLRAITRRQMRHNGAMASIMSETFNVSGALLVKLFGRREQELARFSEEARMVRDLGVRSAVVGRWFFATLALVSSVGMASVFWVGGYLVIQGGMSLGTVIMFSTLLTQLYGPLSAMSNARVEFATSLVSFERVFEVLDLRREISEAPDAAELPAVGGVVEFDQVYFRYRAPGQVGLRPAAGHGRPSGHPEDGGDPPTQSPAIGRWRTSLSVSKRERWQPWSARRGRARPRSVT